MLQTLSMADLRGFGRRFGIDYHFPAPAAGARPAGAAVLRGRVDEQPLSSGLRLTHSRLDVLRPYESRSTGRTAFFLLAVLEGRVGLDIGGRPCTLQAGMAVATHLDRDGTLHAMHPHGQHLRTLTVALDDADARGGPCPSWLAEGLRTIEAAPARAWRVPAHLHQALQQLPAGPGPHALQHRLLLEGLALQLLAHGIGDPAPATPAALSPDERNRLERVRRQLDGAPGLDYSVEQLAAQAAMSVSTFRAKFRQSFGMPVFDYLRDRRLALARQYLLQGYSVQQAAHLSGYRHATNFATAFRKHFGTAPSAID